MSMTTTENKTGSSMSYSEHALLTLHDFEVGYRNSAFLPPIHLQIGRGQAWGLIGPNGGGKTTLLRSILGLLPSLAGTRSFQPDIRISYVPQRNELNPYLPLRARDVVQSGLERGFSFLRPVSQKNAKDRLHDCMVRMGVLELAEHRFGELSEGQKQRVLMARAWIDQPELLILDEPTSAMDTENAKRVLEILESLRTRDGMSWLVVTHDIAWVEKHMTHGIFVDQHQNTAWVQESPDFWTDARVRAQFGLHP